jgi:hypothetical protein
MKLVNSTDRLVRFEIGQGPGLDAVEYKVKPGEVVELPDYLCEERPGGNILSMIAPGLSAYTAPKKADVPASLKPEPKKPSKES